MSHASRLAAQLRAVEDSDDVDEATRRKARESYEKQVSKLELEELAQVEIAHQEGVDLDDVRILRIQQRQVGSTAKYILEGEPGVHYHLIEGADDG